ncbi:hypothetical protein KK062_23945 [Fulvivirgaceae bacterium PWU5]|uniref:Methylamine utilisation protein MauE domain-containing protein n=1 Tax=Dawidia cretensis TaxID=2782350 RepID=A0AAP2E1M0_9BACT|nr:MauE/DoxX family redox-associated membrane protein [Dawidia cretensis]MBT1711316.1 hypothetical protein [Dawidia cretensis]
MKIRRELIIEMIVFLFVLLFLYAAGSKVTEYKQFVGQMGKSPLLTDFAPTLAWLVPIVEIIISVLLIVHRTKLMGLYASFGLMLAFTLYIAAILMFSKELPCSCGGVLSMLGWKQHLIFNIAFVGLAVVGIVLMNKEAKPGKLNVLA